MFDSFSCWGLEQFSRFLTTNFLGSTSPIRQLSTAKRIACEMQHNSSQSADIPRSHSKLCMSFISKLWSKSRKSHYWPQKNIKNLTKKSSLQKHFSKNREQHYRSEDDVIDIFSEAFQDLHMSEPEFVNFLNVVIPTSRL